MDKELESIINDINDIAYRVDSYFSDMSDQIEALQNEIEELKEANDE